MFFHVARAVPVIVGLSLLTSTLSELHARKRGVVRRALPDGTRTVTAFADTPRLFVHLVWPRGTEADHLGHIHALAWASACQERAEQVAYDAVFHTVIDDQSVAMAAELSGRRLPNAAAALTECVFAPVFSTRALDEARGRVLARLGATHSVSIARLVEHALSSRPRPASLDEQISAIHALRVADLIRHHRGLIAGPAAVAAVGPIDPQNWIGELGRLWPERTVQPRVQPPPSAGAANGSPATGLAAARQLFVYRGGPTTDIGLAFVTPRSLKHPSLLAELLVARIERIQNRGRAGFRAAARANGAAIELYLSCSADQTRTVITELAEIVDRLRTQGPSPGEIARARRRLQDRAARQTPAWRAAQLARAELFDHLLPDQVTGAAPSADAIARSMRDVLDWRLATLVTVQPLATSPSAARRIRGRVHKARPVRRSR